MTYKAMRPGLDCSIPWGANDQEPAWALGFEPGILMSQIEAEAAAAAMNELLQRPDCLRGILDETQFTKEQFKAAWEALARAEHAPPEPEMDPEIRAVDRIFAALGRAQAQHPGWPEDAIHGCAIIQEELGEAFKEAIDYSFHTAGAEMTVCLERLLEELAQTGAVTIRHMVQIAGMIELRNEEDQT